MQFFEQIFELDRTLSQQTKLENYKFKKPLKAFIYQFNKEWKNYIF
jgi:hypothetical protein